MNATPVTALPGQRTGPRQRIGELLLATGRLTEHDVHRVMAHQKKKGLRFGEAARGLKLINGDELLEVLARQFAYPYVRREDSHLSPLLLSAYQPFSAGAEAFRVLRSQLMLRWFEREQTFLAVVSPRSAAGSSTVAANLAISFAQLGRRTLLLDANFRSPAQDALFGLAADTGLADVLLGRSPLEHASFPIPQLNDLTVLCTGPIPPNPQELLSSRALDEVLAILGSLYEVVIIDTAPALDYADAQVVAARAGGYVLVTRRNRTRIAEADATHTRLAPGGAVNVGLVINN